MKLNIPDMNNVTKSQSGSRGPEKEDVKDLSLVHTHDHVHTIHDIDHITRASAFGEDHRPVTPDLVTTTQGGVPATGKPSAAGKQHRPMKA